MPQQYAKPMVMVITWVLSLAVGTVGAVHARSAMAAIQQSQETPGMPTHLIHPAVVVAQPPDCVTIALDNRYKRSMASYTRSGLMICFTFAWPDKVFFSSAAANRRRCEPHTAPEYFAPVDFGP